MIIRASEAESILYIRLWDYGTFQAMELTYYLAWKSYERFSIYLWNDILGTFMI